MHLSIGGDAGVTGKVTMDNKVEVVSDAIGVYTLKYIDVDGNPLEDYADICSMTVDKIATYEDFIDVNIAPREASVIGIYGADGERVGTILLSDFRPDFSQKPLYSFGILSDVHIGRSVINPEADFERALKLFNSKGVAHTCICGDITQNGKEAELQGYKSILPVANAPVYTVTGNHDATTKGVNLDLWTQYINLPIVFEKSVEANGKTDHFLFLGMNIWNFAAPYLDEHLAWLEEKLEAYRNERCFIITHLFFPDRAGNLNGIYPSGNWLRGEQLERLQNEVVDIEEMNTGVSIMDLGLNEFRLDLLDYVKNKSYSEHAPYGMHAVIAATDDCPKGVVYVLKNRSNSVNIDQKNRLHPFYMVYLTDDGEVFINHLQPKELLDRVRYMCRGKVEPIAELCRSFNKETKDGYNMKHYSDLLGDAITSIISVKEQSDIDLLLSGFQGELFTKEIKGLDDFELICFLVVR